MDEYLGGFKVVALDALGARVLYVGVVAFDSRDMNDTRSEWIVSAGISTSVPFSAISLGRAERLE
jgi:hypothetical protein